MKPKYVALIAACFASMALAAPKVENVTVDPSQPKFTGDKPPEVEVSVNVSRTKFDKGGCEARVEFGDGEGRTLDFDVASKRNVKHTYKKGGSYTVVAKGTGKRPCDGMAQLPVVVQGPPPPKPAAKPAPKKAEPKKAEKKAPAKKAPAKKADDKKKAPAKKAPAKKDEKKDDASK